MASADGNNGGKWDKNFFVALLGLFAAIAALAVAVTTPKIRQFLGFEESSPVPQPAPEPVAPPIEKKKTVQSPAPEKPKIKPVTPTQHPAEPPEPPSLYILHENEPEFVETANATLSFSLTTINQEPIVSLHIAPNGRKASNHAVWTGDSAEFSSASGEFLVSILSVNYDERAITVQVSAAQ